MHIDFVLFENPDGSDLNAIWLYCIATLDETCVSYKDCTSAMESVIVQVGN